MPNASDKIILPEKKSFVGLSSKQLLQWLFDFYMYAIFKSGCFHYAYANKYYINTEVNSKNSQLYSQPNKVD